MKVPVTSDHVKKNGRAQPHSKTLARLSARVLIREVLECGCPEIVSKFASDVVEKKIGFHIFDMAHFDFCRSCFDGLFRNSLEPFSSFETDSPMPLFPERSLAGGFYACSQDPPANER